MSKHKDKLPGGLADKKQPKDFNNKSLAQGTKVEKEHTGDKSTAREIAMDHLTEDKDYYKKLKTIEKQEFTEITADGKQQIVQGKEPLKKDPNDKAPLPVLTGPEDKKKISLKDKWKKLKKALDNSVSIMDLKEEAGFNDQEEQPQEEQPQEEQQDIPPEMMQQLAEQSQQGEQPQEQPQIDSEVQESDPGIPNEGDENTEPQQEEQVPPEMMQQPEGEEPQNEEAPSKEELEESLRTEGYSESEIQYIVHGRHSPPVDNGAQKRAIEEDLARQEGEHELGHKKKESELDLAHKQRMSDVEYESAKASQPDPQLDKEHKKRMLDLEYETVRQQKAMELEFKRKEMELKLKHAEEAMKQKLNSAVVAKKTEKEDE
jgi:hypothetical protein